MKNQIQIVTEKKEGFMMKKLFYLSLLLVLFCMLNQTAVAGEIVVPFLKTPRNAC